MANNNSRAGGIYNGTDIDDRNAQQRNDSIVDELIGYSSSSKKKRELKTNAGVPKYPNRTHRTKNKGRSRVWDYYNDITPDANQYCGRYQAECSFCNYVIKGEPLRMRNHLIKKCLNCPSDVKDLMEEDNQLCFMKKRKKEQHLIIGPSTASAVGSTANYTHPATAAQSSTPSISTKNLSLDNDDHVPEWARTMVNSINNNVTSQLSSLKESVSLQIASHKAQVQAQLLNTNARLTNLETPILTNL